MALQRSGPKRRLAASALERGQECRHKSAPCAVGSG